MMASTITLSCRGSYAVEATPEQIATMAAIGGYLRLTRGDEVAIFPSSQVSCVATCAHDLYGASWAVERFIPAMAEVG